MPTTYAIPNGSTAFAATTYTGNGSTQSISNAVNGTSFQPDFVWYKDRSNARDHGLFDSVRGVTNYLASNLTSAEVSVSGVTAFNSDGFTLGGNINSNNSGETYVGWQWKANGAAVTNTAGSITSQVSANTAAGFSIVTYTGTGSAATIGHGIGTAPNMVIVKRRSSTSDWVIYHSGLPSAAYRIYLNYDLAQDSGAAAANTWNSTAPTSTVFSVGTNANSNSSGGTFVAYCFAAVPGYSAFGSYTGNGSSDGPFQYLGFRPRFVMFKKSSGADDWVIYDTSRNTFNVASNNLFPNGNFAEDSNVTNRSADILSNGFKIRSSGTFLNGSGSTFIWAAFGETPFAYSNAR
jgi:hypothetical protein